ncbi:Nuclease [Sphingobium herbicidovorans NBRC 16415]|uniref:Nuclease n=2 Tax=Sphingobium herbicidovorans TaxID=76947 RepID=A0A086PBE4_SPHHM|nr:Nuclease [Sphingobium herbicidovorans NBRC 16415]
MAFAIYLIPQLRAERQAEFLAASSPSDEDSLFSVHDRNDDKADANRQSTEALPIMISSLLLAAAITVVDGDTLRINGERIRLLGIDAPEIHGCRQGRVCVPSDGQASKRSLEAIMSGQISVQRVGQDRYGRTLAQVYVRGRNVACEQLRRGQAVYVGKWDNGGLLAADCR